MPPKKPAKLFSFAHLLGRSRAEAAPDDEETPAAEGEEEEPQSECGEEKPKPKGEEDEPEAEGEEDEPQAEGEMPDEEETPQARSARLREQRRCARILASPHTSGRLETACHLAFNTRMTSGQAIALLKTMPKASRASASSATRGNPLALQQMDSTRQPQVGPARDKASGHEQLAQSVLGNLASVGLIRKQEAK